MNSPFNPTLLKDDELEKEYDRYLKFVDDEFFYDIDNKSVTEIAPFTGHQTVIIYKHKLTSLTLIEPCILSCDRLKSRFQSARIINEDIFTAYKTENLSSDVVICFGLLYHLHSPLFLLECIVNQSNPDTIILDSINTDKCMILPENINNPGMMRSNRKIIPYNLSLSFDIINQALESMGYYCEKQENLNQFSKIPQKKFCWIARWKKL